MEKWAGIKGYEGFYQVSNKGRVRSLDRVNIMPSGKKIRLRGKMLKITIDTITGYAFVKISKNGAYRKTSVHRLVASAFLPNVENFPIVNHKNEVCDDNHVGNLEWCTHQYNSEYSLKEYHSFISPSGHKTIIFNLNRFCREHGLLENSMRQVKSGRNKSHRGWISVA